MNVIGLLSGGKDSMYNLMCCVAHGHILIGIAHLKPPIEELDSYMYQSVGHSAIPFIAQALNLPLFQTVITGSPLLISMDYSETEADEVEDLFNLLKMCKETTNVEAISVGAILSNYQRIRVQHVCDRLNLHMLAYLWEANQLAYVQTLIRPELGLDARLVKTATMGLLPNNLGKSLDQAMPILLDLHNKWGISIAGEGGEYETLVFDSPLFRTHKLKAHGTKTVLHSNQVEAPVAYLTFDEFELISKHRDSYDDADWRSLILSTNLQSF